METINILRYGDGSAIVEMARPAVFNAFDEQMIGELTDGFLELSADPDVRAIVLRGQGKAFSAGADLKWMQRASEASADQNVQDARRFAEMLHTVASSPKPTIARVHGLALGGGVGLACACDIAVAGEDALFAVSETRFGILPSVIGPYLINAVGKRHALRLALTGRRIASQEAMSIGLVASVAAPGELDDAVQLLLTELLANGPQALSETKTLFRSLSIGPVTPEIRELTAQTIARVRDTEEARDGFSAFLGKRPAAWIRV